MGYTSVRDIRRAVVAAAALARKRHHDDGSTSGSRFLVEAVPLLVDQVMAEAGVFEPAVAARSLAQARGDMARAVSLVRAWAATLPRLAPATTAVAELRVVRRITPAFADPPGGQHLGPSLDYESRLLDLEPEPDDHAEHSNGDLDHREDGAGGVAAPPMSSVGNGASGQRMPRPARALGQLEDDGLVSHLDRAQATDRTRSARAETGALTALAYAGQRGFAARVDPTLVELRAGSLPVRIVHPVTGGPVEVGRVTAAVAEVVLYRVHDGAADARFSIGFGSTFGLLERRSIAAAMLDANCARADGSAGAPAPSEDQEFLSVVLDGQESSGFVEHLKLPHHVTFASDLDRVRQASAGANEEAGADE
jgi:alpha-D-ribose 1-methylphosphonate 5-triphosphate synthase subunit PhnI